MDQNKNAQGTQKADQSSQQNRVHQPSDSGAEQYSGNRGGNSANQEQGAGKQGEKNSSSDEFDQNDDLDSDMPTRGSDR
jgi:hypothetical protein